MAFDPKALKKIADACRKAGISHYKCDEYEFTLTPDAPISNYKKRQKKIESPSSTIDEPFKADTLTEEQLLLWSAGEATGESM